MSSMTSKITCPRCGVQVKKGVLRCRDCGAFLDQGAADSARSKQSWPGLPEDAAQRAADAAAAAMNLAVPERSEDELQHDMSFADSLFRQVQSHEQPATGEEKEDDFLLDVTPVSPGPESIPRRGPPTSGAAQPVKPTAARPPTPESPPASRTGSTAAPAANVSIDDVLAQAPVVSPQQPVAPSPAAAHKPVAAPPAAASPAPPSPEFPAIPSAVPPVTYSYQPPPPQQPVLPPGYVIDPYTGYPTLDYGASQQGYPPAGPQGYPAPYPGGEYPPADYSAYPQQYGYGEYPAGMYPQYDPNYAAQYGYQVDPNQYAAQMPYPTDPSQSGYDPNLSYPLESPPGEAGAGELPPSYELADAPAEELPAEVPTEEAPVPAAEAAAESPPAEVGEVPATAAPAGAAEAAPPTGEVVKSHSEETAGDVLLAAALEEESSRGTPGVQKKKEGGKAGAKAVTVLSVFCPYGHRVQVPPKFVGKAGRCPLCKTTFFVPADLLPVAPEAVAEPAAPTSADNRIWLDDVRLQRVNPSKVKFTPGSLAEEYDTVDVGLNADGLLITVVFKGGAMFRAMQEPKKKPATRKAIREHLAAGKPSDQTPALKQWLIKAENLTQLKMLQPVPPGAESLFSGVPVFGEGRIVVRIPPPEAPEQRWCLSLTLTQFREFCKRLIEFYGLADFCNSCGIPLEDEYEEGFCGFSDNLVASLTRVELYQADPAFQLEVVARKCAGCGVLVDETVRQQHQIGGKNDSSVAKAKCPKCQAKFGDIKLYRAKAQTPAAAPVPTAEAEAAASSPVPSESVTTETPTLSDSQLLDVPSA